jgi:hypothetical protein
LITDSPSVGGRAPSSAEFFWRGLRIARAVLVTCGPPSFF